MYESDSQTCVPMLDKRIVDMLFFSIKGGLTIKRDGLSRLHSNKLNVREKLKVPKIKHNGFFREMPYVHW